MYFNAIAIPTAVSTSIRDPLAISKNLFLSAVDFLEQPSARFKWIEQAALRICCVRPNFSDSGKYLVRLYDSRIKSLDLAKTINRVWASCKNITVYFPKSKHITSLQPTYFPQILSILTTDYLLLTIDHALIPIHPTTSARLSAVA